MRKIIYIDVGGGYRARIAEDDVERIRKYHGIDLEKEVKKSLKRERKQYGVNRPNTRK